MVFKKINSSLVLMFLISFPIQGAVNSAKWQAAANQEVHIGNGSEPKELDPATSTGVPESRIADNLFEGLTKLDPFTFQPIPGMAESWDVSADGKIYHFKIRKNAKWSDGKALNAHDFVWSWTRALAPKTASEYAYQLYYIKNGEKFNKGEIKDAKQLGVEATDSHTLKVTLENPTAFFLRLTSFHTLFPTPKHVIEKFPDKEWTKPGKLVNNGPFKLLEWKLNNYIKLVPNEHYWNKEKIKVTSAYFHPIENQDTEEKSFFAGELHQTYEVPNIKIPTYAKQKERNSGSYHPFKTDPMLASYFYRFNTTKKPFNDPRVRKAFALTVDRKLLVEKVAKGGQLPAQSLTPPDVADYTFAGNLPVSVTPEVIKEAQKLLADAGYPNGKNFPKIDILYNTSENHKKIAIAIQQMWKKFLNVEVGMYNQEWKVYLNSEKKLDFHVSRAGWVGDYPDPNTFLDMFVTGGLLNKTGWGNKDYDKYIEAASQTIDHQKRIEYFKKAESILMDELPIIPIYIYTKVHLISEKLKMISHKGDIVDWKSNLTDRVFLDHLVLVK